MRGGRAHQWVLPVALLAALGMSCANDGSSSAKGSAAAGAGSGFRVTAITPADGTSGVPHDAEVRIAFTDPVDPATVTETTVQLEAAGRPVAADRVVSGQEVLLTPRVVLAAGVEYRVRVTLGVQAGSGQPLRLAATARFTTDPLGGQRTLTFQAGAAAVEITPQVGVPLGGHTGQPRRLIFPDLNPLDFHTLFEPSVGVNDPLYAKALVLDDGLQRAAIVTVDLIASDNRATEAIALELAGRGVAIDPDHILICASHTHTGPGAISQLHFWEIAAMDFFKSAIFNQLVGRIADAIEEAVDQLEPAELAIGLTQLHGLTKNRRDLVSPHYTEDSIDPDLGVIRVDRPNGTAIATVYNFAIHGLAYPPEMFEFSADLMGEASRIIEQQAGGIALFCNAAEGDIVPNEQLAQVGPALTAHIGAELAGAVLQLRAGLTPEADVDLLSSWERIDMGDPFVGLDTSMAAGSTPGWLQPILAALPTVGLTVPLAPDWMDRTFRYQAIRLQNTLLSSVPGEAIHEVGLEIKQAGQRHGFDHTFVMGLANGHMSYVTTEREYHLGGYEGLATLYGEQTGEKVVDACEQVMQQVKR